MSSVFTRLCYIQIGIIVFIFTVKPHGNGNSRRAANNYSDRQKISAYTTHTIFMNNIVIIGGATGIGLSLIRRLMNDPDYRITSIARETCDVEGVTNIVADVTDDKTIVRAIAESGKIDTLVYCAGISLAAPVEYAKKADIKNIFDVNIISAILCIKAALPALCESERPKIVLLSSSGSIAPIAYDSFYSATKAGLNALAMALRLECPKIKCSAVIVPGTQTLFSFRRKIYDDCGDYNDTLKSAAKALQNIEQSGYSVDYVSSQIINILEKRNPPPVCTVGCMNKVMLGLYKILPWRLKLYALEKIYRLK